MLSFFNNAAHGNDPNDRIVPVAPADARVYWRRVATVMREMGRDLQLEPQAAFVDALEHLWYDQSTSGLKVGSLEEVRNATLSRDLPLFPADCSSFVETQPSVVAACLGLQACSLLGARALPGDQTFSEVCRRPGNLHLPCHCVVDVLSELMEPALAECGWCDSNYSGGCSCWAMAAALHNTLRHLSCYEARHDCVHRTFDYPCRRGRECTSRISTHCVGTVEWCHQPLRAPCLKCYQKVASLV